MSNRATLYELITSVAQVVLLQRQTALQQYECIMYLQITVTANDIVTFDNTQIRHRVTMYLQNQSMCYCYTCYMYTAFHQG